MPSLASLLSKQGITGVLELPYKWVFAPFILMFAEIIIRCAYKVIKEFMPETKEGVN
jgi:hypothetical protein